MENRNSASPLKNSIRTAHRWGQNFRLLFILTQVYIHLYRDRYRKRLELPDSTSGHFSKVETCGFFRQRGKLADSFLRAFLPLFLSLFFNREVVIVGKKVCAKLMKECSSLMNFNAYRKSFFRWSIENVFVKFYRKICHRLNTDCYQNLRRIIHLNVR